MIDTSDNSIMEFQVVLLLKTAAGKNIAYKTPVYKTTGNQGLGPSLLEMIIVRKLHEWIPKALKEITDAEG
jgi:hypothetical protein